MIDALNLIELEEHARARLSKMAYDYYAGAAADRLTVERNAGAYREIALHYRVLVDVARCDLSTTVLGQPIRMPVMIAPTAFHRLAHPDGEIASAKAAAAAGTIFVQSTLSTSRVEDVALESGCPLWFQLYVYRDRGATEALVRRVENAGCRALVVTVDAPRLGRRENDVRNRFGLPEGMRLENVLAGFERVDSPGDDSGLASYVATLLDASFSWKDLGWLRSLTKLPILLKGIVRADDARKAVDAGIDGIVVSNHGGRQLDTSPATIEVLPRIADAVGGRIEILVDGGVRRGTDVVKALALGARAVLIGRPVLWGLAVGGSEGVRAVLELLRGELELAMMLAGCPTVAEVTRDLVDPPR
jgi:4-hydroxymandelate oxidase